MTLTAQQLKRAHETRFARMIRDAVNATGRATLWTNRMGFDAKYNVPYGLCKGSADLIGVRRGDGRFLALEVKQADGRVEKHQAQWLEYVEGHGAIARVVRSFDEALAAVNEKLERPPCVHCKRA